MEKSTTSQTKSIAFTVLCLGLIFLFAFSAFEKFSHLERFSRDLAKVPFVGKMAPFIAWMVPIIELGIVALLLFPKTVGYGLLAYFVTMFIFTLYIGAMIVWADTLPCSCNVLIEKLTWPQHVWFNLAILGLVAWAAWLYKNHQLKIQK